MRIGEVAERLGLTPRTIKYYEELGLLTPGRSAGNYREYDDDAVERLERIRNLQNLGYSLAAIRELLKYRRHVDESGKKRLPIGDVEKVLRSLEEQLVAVRQRIARARAEVELGERLAVELEADVARCRERLALRKGAVPGLAGTRS